jgi:hypothetical protein
MSDTPTFTVIDNPIADYRLRACGYTIEPVGIRAALCLMRKKHPDGFTRKHLAEILYMTGIPKTKPRGTYVSSKDGSKRAYPDNPAMTIAGRIIERMKDRGILRFSGGRWYFSDQQIGAKPSKYL